MSIWLDPERMGGEPCFTGSRVPVATLFDNLAEGSSLDEILDDFPTINREYAVDVLRRAKVLVVKQALCENKRSTPNPPPDPKTSLVPSTSIGFQKLSWGIPRFGWLRSLFRK